jgi:GMP synthase-like glutamine amidotransferase
MARLLVIDPAVHEPEPESVANVSRGFDGEVIVMRPALVDEHRHQLFNVDCDGAVILGSHTSVYEDAPWLEDLERWLWPILAGERVLPLLGICFAHQLIAKLAGARIGAVREDGEFYAAITTSTLSQSHLVSREEPVPVLAIQRWEVKDVPTGYRRIATRESCAVDGLEHHFLPVVSVQFHPDGGEDMARRHGVHGDMGPVAEAGGDLLAAFLDLL